MFSSLAEERGAANGPAAAEAPDHVPDPSGERVPGDPRDSRLRPLDCGPEAPSPPRGLEAQVPGTSFPGSVLHVATRGGCVLQNHLPPHPRLAPGACHFPLPFSLKCQGLASKLGGDSDTQTCTRRAAKWFLLRFYYMASLSEINGEFIYLGI